MGCTRPVPYSSIEVEDSGRLLPVDTAPWDSGRDTATVETGPGIDSGDTGMPGDSTEPVEPFSQDMLKAFFGPKMVDETAVRFPIQMI